MSRFRRLFPYLRPYSLAFAATLVASLIASFFEGFVLALLIPVTRMLFGAPPVGAGLSVVERVINNASTKPPRGDRPGCVADAARIPGVSRFRRLFPYLRP